MNATPAAFGIVANQSYKAASSSSDDVFYQLKNGDYSKEGYGSVTDELEDYGIQNLSLYNAGLVEQSTGLMFSETEENVYFYTYDVNKRTNYDAISVAFDVNISGSVDLEINPDFQNYKIELVSRSSNFYLCKWKILGFQPNLESNHIYYSRQLTNSAGEVLPAVLSYQYDAEQKQSLCTYETYLEITNKKVAWQLLPGSLTDTDDQTRASQYHYVVFNTSDDNAIDNLTKVEIEYKANYFGGLSTLTTSTHQGYTPIFSINDVTQTNILDIWNEQEETYFTFDINNGQTIKQTIEPSIVNHNYTSGFWFWKHNYNWSFSTIDKVANLDSDLWSTSDISQYKWFVQFRKNDFKVQLPSYLCGPGITPTLQASDRYLFGGPDYSLIFNTTDLIGSVKNLDFESNKENMPIDINDFSILRLWYESDGEIKNSIVVDTYSDSNGTDNIWDPEVEDFATWLSNIKNWWNQNWRIVVAIIAAIVLLPIIIAFFPAVITVLKTIITLPFKLIKWLFGKAK